MRHCWLCGAALPVPPPTRMSYCTACDVFTGTAMRYGRADSFLWQRADGRKVLMLFVDHSAVHRPSPA